MRAWAALLILLVATACLRAAVPVDHSLRYKPSSISELPALAPALWRVAIATLAVVGTLAGAAWLAKRNAAFRQTKSTQSSLKLISTLPLADGSSLYLIECQEKRFVVAIGRGELRSLTALPEPFEEALQAAA